ncbi:transmembrane protein, putative [Medicago truncatula]|uniref:Transmembrane protein, putative n=1 Tax=Medicago truncatula TaxID=3880 RepID=A0A072TEY5_MEDTR|nr:transmembrane protein, putative [Medicago truncatula]
MSSCTCHHPFVVKLCILQAIFVWRIRFLGWIIFPLLTKFILWLFKKKVIAKVVPAPSSIAESSILINASDASKPFGRGKGYRFGTLCNRLGHTNEHICSSIHCFSYFYAIQTVSVS